MCGRRIGVGNVSELPGIGSRQQKGCEHHQYEDRAEGGGCQFLYRVHCMLPAKARPARSASEFAASITRETTRVTLTIRGKSRLSAACPASWPNPGESQWASIGIAAFFLMASRPPRRARSGGADNGRTCR